MPRTCTCGHVLLFRYSFGLLFCCAVVVSFSRLQLLICMMWSYDSLTSLTFAVVHSTSEFWTVESDPNVVQNFSEPFSGYLLPDEGNLPEERSETRPATAGKALEPDPQCTGPCLLKLWDFGTAPPNDELGQLHFVGRSPSPPTSPASTGSGTAFPRNSSRSACAKPRRSSTRLCSTRPPHC